MNDNGAIRVFKNKYTDKTKIHMQYITLFFPALIFLILLTAGTSQAQDEFELKDGDTTLTMKKYFVCFLKTGPERNQDSVTAARIQEEHLAYILWMRRSGFVSAAGPMEGSKDIRGIMIFNVKTKEEAEKLTSDDPAVKAGRLVAEIYPWWSAKGSVLK